MTNPTNIIIVDDHPFIIEGYKNGIKAYKPKSFEFTVCQAKDCQSAYEMITAPDCPRLDVAFLDISMPPYEEKGMHSGINLAWLIKEVFPDCKIIMLTMHNELIEITQIIDSLNPNGLIIKNDLTFDSMLYAFDKILKGNIYYSESIVEFLSKPKQDNNEIDQFDRQILFQLSKGTKARLLHEYVPLSIPAVERRKLNMKEILKITDGTDATLVAVAKERGII